LLQDQTNVRKINSLKFKQICFRAKLYTKIGPGDMEESAYILGIVGFVYVHESLGRFVIELESVLNWAPNVRLLPVKLLPKKEMLLVS